MTITDKINEIIDHRIGRNGFEVINNFGKKIKDYAKH